jgi:hypothetical protein
MVGLGCWSEETLAPEPTKNALKSANLLKIPSYGQDWGASVKYASATSHCRIGSTAKARNGWDT